MPVVFSNQALFHNYKVARISFLSHPPKTPMILTAVLSPSQPEFPNANKDVQNMITGMLLGHDAPARVQTSILLHCEVCTDVPNVLPSSFTV